MTPTELMQVGSPTDVASVGIGAWFSPRAQIVVVTCACAGLSALLYAVDPHRSTIYPQCLLHNATGLYCAGCGATRAVHALLHGRLLEALQDNALFVAALPLIIYVAASRASIAWRANAWPDVSVSGRSLALRAGAIFLLMMTFMVARNLPGFAWLRPV